MRLRVITPDHIILDTETNGVFFSAIDGERGILPGHIPMMTALDIGVTSYFSEDNPKIKEYVSVMGGILKFEDDEVTILTEIAELGDDIDVERAEKSLERARQRIEGFVEKDIPKSDANFERARYSLMRALARIKANKSTAGK